MKFLKMEVNKEDTIPKGMKYFACHIPVLLLNSMTARIELSMNHVLMMITGYACMMIKID